jgi:hypothetical protein
MKTTILVTKLVLDITLIIVSVMLGAVARMFLFGLGPVGWYLLLKNKKA